MLKIEYIWRELLYRAIEQKKPNFAIIELAKMFKLSTSLVSHALFPLRDLNIVKIGKINSQIIDAERLLFFWATRRSFNKDIVYQTYDHLPVFEREALMPPDVFPTAYSAFHFYFKEPLPADYENIYFYSQRLEEVKKRFPQNSKKKANTFILKGDPYLKKYKKTTLAQIFSDLWNLPDWYGKDFQEAVLLKIKQKIGL
jgi:hypothetical protein